MPDFRLHARLADTRIDYDLTAACASREYHGSMAFDRSRCHWVTNAVARVLGRACHHGGGSREDRDDLTKLADDLSRQLLPDELQNQLAAIENATLLLAIDGPLACIPWELVLIDGQPLCLRTSVSRDFPIERRSGSSCVASGSASPVSVAIIANPEFNLPAASREADALRCLFSKHPAASQYRIWTNQVTRSQLLHAFSRSDWLHFAGHARIEDGQTKWRLADGTFGADDIEKEEAASWPAFVFAHACGSADENTPIANSPAGPVDTMAHALANRGTSHFLGTTTLVRDDSCLEFAMALYESLLAGTPVATALLNTRRQWISRHQDVSLLWACYRLFGEPNAVLTDRSARQNEMGSGRESAPYLRDPERLEALCFPTQCTTCGKRIKTRHGVGSRTKTGIVCRECERNAGERVTRIQETHRRHTSTDMNYPFAERARRLEVNFMGRVERMVGHIDRLVDPISARSHCVRLELVSRGTRNEVESRLTLRTPTPTVIQPLNEYRDYELHGLQPFPDAKGPLRFLVQTHSRHVAGVRTQWDVSPVTAVELMHMLESTRPPAPPAGQLMLLASTTGWTEKAKQYASGDREAYYNCRRALVLVSLEDGELAYRHEDLRLKPLAPLFDFADDGDRVTRVVDYVRNQLPLRTSLSAEDVSERLSIPIDQVEIAFRVICRENDVMMERVDGVGLTLY